MARALLFLLAALLAATSQAQILQWAENKICVFVLEKAWDQVNDGACDWVATELTGEAAVLLAETSIAEIIEDPAIYATLDWACNQLAGQLESYLGVAPDEICSDLGLRRTAAGLDPATFQNLTLAGVNRIMAARYVAMKQVPMPVALFPDGTVGHCWRDMDTGVFSCLEPTAHTAPIVSQAPATLYLQTVQTSASSSHTALIVVGTLLGTMLVATLAVCFVLTSRLSELRRQQASPLTEQLLMTGSQ